MLISQFLADFPDLDRDIGDELVAISTQAIQLDRKGKVGIEIGVEKKGQRVMVQVNYAVKPPKADPEAGLYYANPDRRLLSKDDPWQVDFDPATAEIRTPPAPATHPNKEQ